jgi:hypothetical protein
MLIDFRNSFDSVFSYFCILLVVWWCIFLLTACQHFILHCSLHVKLNVINLFNRLSLLANQTASSLPASVKVNHAQYLNCNSVVVVSDAKSGDTEREKAINRKLIMSSSLQLHEDDLSRIDVKSLVSSL